ncbi:DUF1819 family protein [Gordonia pseudamarae]|uniref:DUF1819 family protein n=1 Tax=Gordonia pseudamarae TaxID=2831662 RepID=A0ABX6INJ4_9ACTN|nr:MULTISPECIES: DUF1819 family protein [Gordonia]MBD0020770.1 DUF1819 family protein [Gordonia sp. (in: high G+C Gram-positive bacteria)]QHN27804.1 DUF1819 family protein [Gordonia pseudamarae]QHN36686.1 DUF1819 family protein [Gordonia pseudamarae]
MTDELRYALSFTSGGLLAREAVAVAAIYLDSRDWVLTRARVVDGNLLQARTISSLVRVTRETVQRLAVLDDDEIELLADGSPTEQYHLMWAAACRRYTLIGDFAEEVLRERFLLLTPTLGTDDVNRFLTGKSLWHPELDGLKPSTLQKLRQTLFRMLREAGLRTDAGDIVPAVLSERVGEVLDRRTPSDLRFFPTNTPLTSFGDQVQR